MKQNLKSIKIVYIPTLQATLIYFIVLIIALLLFFGRQSEALKFEFILGTFPNFYQHVSNFSISYMLYSGIGYMWLMLGLDFKYIIKLGAFIILSNLVYELFIPLLNTRDIVDAYYGISGTGLGFLVLWWIKKFALILNEIPENKSRDEESIR